MHETTRARTSARAVRLAGLAAGILLLAGCATGYSFVQPGVAGSGGYYTSESPYSGQGYYDDYGGGPYYPGSNGYDYYGGTAPYGGGYYGPGYYGYAPPWSFNLGISSVWNFPGYWDPWYSAGFPRRGCSSWHCGSRHYRHGHHHEEGPGSWRHGDAPSSDSRDIAGTTEEHDFTERRARAREMNAWRHDHYVRAPRQGLAGSFAGMPARPVPMRGPAPGAASFAGRFAAPTAAPAGWPAPAAFSRAARAAAPPVMGQGMAVRPAPAPAAQPSPRNRTAPAIRIP